jgi:hypothetical protein
MTSHHQQDNLFITYNHPTELKSRKNRRSVSSFASRSYRLTSRKIVLDKSNYRPFIRRDDSATPPLTPVDHSTRRPIRADKPCTILASRNCPIPPVPHPTLDCALGSPKADPFATYPIKVHDYVPFLIDYCESLPPYLGTFAGRIPIQLIIAFSPSLCHHSSRGEHFRNDIR